MNRIASRRLTGSRLVHVMHRYCVLGYHLPHLLYLLLQFVDSIVVPSYRSLGLAVLLLKHLLLRCHAFQFLAQRLGCCLQLLPLLHQLLQLQFVFHESMLLDLFLPFEFFPVLPKLLQLPLFSFTFSICLALSFLGHLQLMFETTLHLLCGLSLTLNGGILFLELTNLSS